LTSTEIAQALTLDLKVVRTALTPLQRQRQIVRRTAERNVPETYEYACPSVSHEGGPCPFRLVSGISKR
jgi:transcription initiation factor IIE alpha subunit